MPLPADPAAVRITVQEGEQYLEPALGPSWHGTDGDHRVILCHVTLDRKTSRRAVSLEFPGVPKRMWTLDLASDPEPMSGFTDWQLPAGRADPKIEMNYRLTAER